MMKFPLLLFSLFCYSAIAQQADFQLLFSVTGKHDFIWTDNLKNLYIIDESEIEMFSPTGELRYKNSQLNLGEITSVDFNFSLKPMLFFGNQNTVVILDNTLSVQGNPVKLNDYALNWVTAAAKSVDNHYWFFDLQNFELVRTDNTFKKVRSSGNISQMLQQDVQPNFIVEHDNWVYVNNPETGILVFDIFGTYFKQIPIRGLDVFQVNDRYITYFSEDKIFRYDLRTFETIKWPLPETTVRNGRVVKDLFFLSREDAVSVYRKI